MRKGILIGIAAALLITTGAAASSYLITSVNQIRPNVRRALKGDRGPRGYQGSTGATGTFSSSNVTTVTGPAGTMPPDGVGSSVATCPTNDTAIAGGWDEDDPAVDSSVTENQALFGSWEVIVVNNDQYDSASVAAVAECATGSSGLVAHDASRAKIAAIVAHQVVAARLRLRQVATAAKVCPAHYTHAIIGGSQKCLHAGEYCSHAEARQYRRYRFVCERVRGTYRLEES